MTKQEIYQAWMSQHMGAGEESLPLPVRAGLAIKRMFRRAIIHEADISVTYSLPCLIQEEPTRAVWAHCGSASRLYRDVLIANGYAADLVGLWNAAPTNTHVAVLFGGNGYDAQTFYDPLYGTSLNRNGRWATLREIMLARAGHDIGITAAAIDEYGPAASSIYQVINKADYNQAVWPRYWNAVCTRDAQDSPPGPGKEWIIHVYDQSKADPAVIRSVYGPGKSLSIFCLM